MIRIEKIALINLQAFVDSKEYKSFVDKPISSLRVQSYLKNPNANEDDFVLYMAFSNDILVGYRTIFADTFISNNKKQKFGWLSGNWVHPNYRRKNISSTLFDEVYTDWNANLMYTNYAEASKAVYDKTDTFTVLKSLHGLRYYRRVCLAGLLAPKANFFKKIKPVFTFIDWSSNLFLDFRFSSKKNLNKQIEIIDFWNDEITDFLKKVKDQELFNRDSKGYNWIQSFPWISSDSEVKKESEQYYFSLYAKKHKVIFYKIIAPNTDKIIAFIAISIRDKKLKIPYLYALPEAINIVKNLIFTICDEHQINHATIYHSQLNNVIKNNKNPFLKHRTFEQKYMVTKKLLLDFPEIKNYEIQTGDGDGVFT